MSFNKKFFTTGGIVASSEGACTADDLNPFTGEVADGGVALYSLDYDASDASGDYDGTPTDVDFGVGGQVNYGARFNGSSSTIDTGYTPPAGSNDFSISCWLNWTGASTDGVWSTFTNSGTNRLGIGLAVHSSGRVDCNVFDSAGLATLSSNDPNVISTNQWYNVVITYDGGLTKMYIDGTLQTSTVNQVITAHFASLHLGNYYASLDNANMWQGSIDQVRIFSKALNQSEVDTLYAETACVYTSTTDIVNYPTGTTPVAYYKLDNSSEDYVGSNDGTETDIEYRFGRYGQAAVFNGSSSHIDISNFPNSMFKDSTNGYTVSLWFKRESGTSSSLQAFFGTALQTKALNVYFRQSDNLFQIENGSASAIDITGGFTYDDGNWHHFVLTDTKVYIDGSEIMTYTGNYPSTFTDGQTFHIGSRHSASRLYYGGSIDQVRIYSTALDSDQVAELYNEKPEVDTSNFKAVLYEGNGGSQYISNVGFQPDLVWVKNRDTSGYYHNLYDSIRGATYRLFSNLPNAHDSNGVLSSFDANGFYLTGAGDANASGQSIIAWVWKGGGDAVNGTGSGVTNVSVSANTEAGFSIVKYTGSGAAGMTVGHGLTEAIPELVIIKNLDNTTNWQVFGGSLFTRMQLDQTGDDDLNLGLTITSTTIQTTQTSGQEGNSAWNANDDYIAYCWHSVSGYSKIGTYEGTNSTVTVSDVGFKPSFVMIKNIDDSADWVMLDNRRNTIDDRLNNWLRANDDAQETGAVSTAYITVNDNGFIVASATSLGTNADGDTYIYMAFK